MPATLLQGFAAAVAVSDAGGYAAAAGKTGISEKSLRRQVAALERLFARPVIAGSRGRRVVAPEAVDLIASAGTCLQTISDAARRCRASGRPETVLRLSLPPFWLNEWLLPREAALIRAMPGQRIVYMESSAYADFDGVDAPSAGFRLGRPPAEMSGRTVAQWPGLVERFLFEERQYLMAAPAIAREIMSATGPLIERVCRHPLLAVRGRPFEWPEWAAAQGGDLPSAARLRAHLHRGLLLPSALNGRGVGFLPAQGTAVDRARGRLVVISDRPAPSKRWWYLVHPPHQPEAVMSDLAAWLRAELEGDAL